MPNLGGLIFSSVTSYVLQPERTKVVNKKDNLDTLSEVYTGPAGGEDTFIPTIGTPHLLYNLMTLISAGVKQQPALVVEITLNYQGKLANGGAEGYTSVPTVSKSWMEGEVTYQRNSSAGYTVPVNPGSGFVPFTYTMKGIASYSRRYTGRCVTIAYITNRIPTGQPTGIGLQKGFMGFQNIWDTMTGFSAGVELSGAGDPYEQMACTDVRVEDRGDGWYRVTETYQSKMFPGNAGFQFTTPTVSAGNIASNTKKADPQEDKKSANSNNDQTQQAQDNPQAGASSGDYTLTTSDQGSSTNVPADIGSQTADQTGMDPNLAGYPTTDTLTASTQGGEPYTGSANSDPWAPAAADFAPSWTT